MAATATIAVAMVALSTAMDALSTAMTVTTPLEHQGGVTTTAVTSSSS